jgi:hypothetical protein
MEESNKTIQLFDVKVIFADLEDRGFGRNIVIDATDQATQDAISIWVKDNNINGGKAHFKDYTTKDGEETKQYTFKLSEYTQFGGDNNLDEKSIGYGATINLLAKAYDYDNKFGKGTSASLRAVYVKEGAVKSALSEISK